MAQTWCRVRMCLRNFHTGQTIFKKATKTKKKLQKAPISKIEKPSPGTVTAQVVEAPSKVPLFVQQLSDSDWTDSGVSMDKTNILSQDQKSLEDLDKSLEELESELKSLKHLKESLKFQKFQKHPKKDMKDVFWGTPDPKWPASEIPCGGCGSNLHCNDTALPGYLPQEKYKDLSYKDLETTLCYRCYCLSNTGKVVNIDVDKATYQSIIKRIRMEKCLVVMVIDVTDIKNSIIPDYMNQVGKIGRILIVANKIDLIPKDRDSYLTKIKEQVYQECVKANLNPRGNNIKDVCLISAKTGYGIEEMITKLVSYWEMKGNVYLVGTTNSGKSTLFNKFLDSDYCKSSCRDYVQRATVSRWPGTTLNLIKFPIVNMNPYMSYLRHERLKGDLEELSLQKQQRKERLKKWGRSNNAILIGKVGKTEFRSESAVMEEMEKYLNTGAGFSTYSMDVVDDEEDIPKAILKEKKSLMEKRRVVYEGYPDSAWTYDTPGLINKDQVINFLTATELRLLLHYQMIRPRVFVMKPGDTMFVTGLARVDYIEGDHNTLIVVFTCHFLPVHVMKQQDADNFYAENVGTEALGLPLGEEGRLQRLPSLCAREFVVETGDEHFMTSADIQLSSLGWISVGGQNKRAHLQVYTPGGRGMSLRKPALLPNISAYMGTRKQGTKSYNIRRLKP